MTTVSENRRTQVQTASGLNCLAAIWLFISAFVIVAHGPMVSNNLIFGVIVFTLAVIRFGGALEQGWISWINALIGLWVIISPWAIMGDAPNGPTQGMIVNNCITGGVVLVLGLWSAFVTSATPTQELNYPNANPTRPSFGR
jgi:hypothetical protein